MSLRGPAPELWRFVVWGVPSLLAVAGAVSIELRHGLPTIGPLKLLGDGSYSIYLLLTFVFFGVFYGAHIRMATLPAPVVVVSVTVAGTCVGLAAFDLCERPLTAALRRLTRRIVVVPGNVDIFGGKPRRRL